MKKNKIKPFKTVLFGLFLLSGIIFLSGCEDTIMPLIEEEVRLAELSEYKLTILEPAMGSVTPSGPVTVKDGEPLDISATATDQSTFINWFISSGEEFLTIGDIYSASTTLSLSGGNVTIQPIISDTLWTLTLNNDGNGTTTPAASASVPNGQPYPIAATANTGYEFDEWISISGAVSFANNLSASTNVTVTGGDATIEAQFKLKEYTVTINNDGNGSTNLLSTVVTHGLASVTITATPSAGYNFVNWTTTSGATVTFNSGSTSSSTTITTAGTSTIRANFALKSYQLWVNALGPGNISIPSSSPVTVTHGVSQTISASNPTNRGYYFSGWTKTNGSGTPVFANASSRYTSVTVTGNDVTIQANYLPITATISHRGTLELNDGGLAWSNRLDTVTDLKFNNNYVYISGDYNDRARIIKVDVSSATSPSVSNYAHIGGNYNTVATEMTIEGSNLRVSVSGSFVSNASGGIYLSTIAGFGPSSFGTGVRSSSSTYINRLTGNYIYTQSDDIYSMSGQGSTTADTNIEDILYVSDYNLIYVTGTDDMGSSGSLSVISYNSGFTTVGSLLTMPQFPEEMTFGGDLYIYAAASNSGVVTFNIDDNPVYIDDVEGASSNTGAPKFIDADGNYLYTFGPKLSTGGNRLAVFDIHNSNGSDNEPFYLTSSAAETSGVVRGIDSSGNYIYTLEGTSLVVYEIIKSTN